MKPKPFASLNHFTVPVFTGVPFFSAKTESGPGRTPSDATAASRSERTGHRIRGRSTIQKGRQLVAGGPNLRSRTSACYRIRSLDASTPLRIQPDLAPADWLR